MFLPANEDCVFPCCVWESVGYLGSFGIITVLAIVINLLHVYLRVQQGQGGVSF